MYIANLYYILTTKVKPTYLLNINNYHKGNWDWVLPIRYQNIRNRDLPSHHFSESKDLIIEREDNE